MATLSTATLVTLLIAQGARAGCATSDAPPAPRPLRFVSFNVLHGGLGSELWGDGDRLERRLELAARELGGLDADVIGLQEASQGRRRGDVAARLAATLGFEHIEAGSIAHLLGIPLFGKLASFVIGFEEGPAILSRFPITATTTRTLDGCDAIYPRVLLCAEVCTPWGPIETCSTHLNGSACQAASVDRELPRLGGVAPVVLMGDLNATEDSPALALLRAEGFVDTFRVANPTVPGFTDDQELGVERATAAERDDYVLVSSGSDRSGQVLASRVVLDRPAHGPDGAVLWTSDHYGVLSDVDLFGHAAPAQVQSARLHPGA